MAIFLHPKVIFIWSKLILLDSFSANFFWLNYIWLYMFVKIYDKSCAFLNLCGLEFRIENWRHKPGQNVKQQHHIQGWCYSSVVYLSLQEATCPVLLSGLSNNIKQVTVKVNCFPFVERILLIECYCSKIRRSIGFTKVAINLDENTAVHLWVMMLLHLKVVLPVIHRMNVSGLE